MLESTFVMEAAKLFGIVGFVVAILFVIWLITQRANDSTLKAITLMVQENQRSFFESSSEQTKAMIKQYDRMFQLQGSTNDKTFDLLKEIQETNRMQASTLAHLETKIDSNQFCPLMKKGDR